MFNDRLQRFLPPDRSKTLSVSQHALPVLPFQRMPRLSRRVQIGTLIAAAVAAGFTFGAVAQTIDVRQWQGVSAGTRQPEQVVASTQAEWRSLWSRVGLAPPEGFEPGRTNAVGIFLGPRAEGSNVNVISTSRRRDRIVVVFEERVPVGSNTLTAQRPAPRTISGSAPPMGGPGSAGFAAGNAPPAPPAMASRALPGPTTTPWAIVLINRSDLPVSVEQRLFR